MTTAEKKLIDALNEINLIIFAQGAPLGSDEYFKIRKIAVDAIIGAGGKVK
jgi:hypothetical protein